MIVVLVKQNELVRDDAHLLESDRLRLCPREAFNDPAFLTCFNLLDLLLDELDDDLVTHVTVSLHRLLNILSVRLVLLSDLTSDEISDRDAVELLPFL